MSNASVRFRDGRYEVCAGDRATHSEIREAREIADQLNSTRARSVERRAANVKDSK